MNLYILVFKSSRPSSLFLSRRELLQENQIGLIPPETGTIRRTYEENEMSRTTWSVTA